ncbi:MAG: ABC transporter permease [Hyphomicrobiaceae bacterium]|nr:ABC transporter permease [Hyphomicrobiaceae bacterium]
MNQLLYLETIVKLAFGLPLVLAPMAVLKTVGLYQPPTSFWPRLVGALLLGLSAATFIEIRLPGSKGLGLYGVIAINLTAALALLGLLIMDAGAPTRRGRGALWLCICLLVLLALAEIADI